MAFWIQTGWRIPDEGLKQWMWNPKKAFLDAPAILKSVFKGPNATIRYACKRHHCFTAFKIAFPAININYTLEMPQINIINCKLEGCTTAFPFAPSMFSEASTTDNMAVFEDLVIKQIGLKKDDPYWDDLMTLW